MEELENIKDKLLRLIEEGDATVILSPEYIESLNELIKHEFISIENEELQLTEKGVEAKVLGVKALMDKTVPPAKELNLDGPQQKINLEISNSSFLIILFFFLASILAMLTFITF